MEQERNQATPIVQHNTAAKLLEAATRGGDLEGAKIAQGWVEEYKPAADASREKMDAARKELADRLNADEAEIRAGNSWSDPRNTQ